MRKHGGKIRQLFQEIKSDLYRYEGGFSFVILLKSFYISHLGFRISTYYRINHHLYRSEKYLLARLFSLKYKRISKKYGVDIPYETQIGYGIYMPHPFTIIINGKSKIGNNCNLHQGVTIGEAGRANKKGNPSIDNNVYIGPGAKIFGKIKVGSNCAIGSNCVLNFTTAVNEVIVGIPGKVVSNKGSIDFLKNIYHE